MSLYHDLGHAMEDDDVMMADLGDFDPDLFWLDAQNESGQEAMLSQEQMECDPGGSSHPQQPPGPISPWDIFRSPPAESCSTTIERGSQTAHRPCGELNNTGHETRVLGDGWQTAPIGFDDQRSVMLSPRPEVSTYMQGNGYQEAEGQDQVNRVNRDELRSLTMAIQDPAALLPMLLPPAAEVSRAGVGPSESCCLD